LKRSILRVIFLMLLAGCASQNQGPTHDTGTLIGEVGDPRNRAKLHTELASLYYGSGNFGVALEELRIAQSADSGYAPAYGMLGLVYMQLKENGRAEESFERALRLSPNDADINHNYGWFLCQTGREPASIKYFLHAIRNPLYPTPWRSYSAAGVCTMKSDAKSKDAEAFFERALRLEPDEPAALLHLGQIRYRQGNVGEARKLVARHNKLVNPSAESLWLAVRIERKLGERLQEQAFANQLRRRFPDSPEYQALQRGKYD
jgi:type IV pilus assembly protein PilF